jgi:hypothetical protein
MFPFNINTLYPLETTTLDDGADGSDGTDGSVGQ